MKIIYKADKPENWIENIAKQLSVKVHDGRIDIPHHFGTGFMQQVPLADGLFVYFFETVLNIPVEITRQESENQGIFPIMFWISNNDISQTLGNETRKLSLNSPYGIFFPSSHISTQIQLPALEKISNVTIVFTRKWFVENIKSKNNTDPINILLRNQSHFFIFEDISLQIRGIIQQIVTYSNVEDYTLLYLKGKILELLSIFFIKVNNRKNPVNKNNINFQDVQILFEARKILLSDFSKMPVVKEICMQIGMSESKFQKLFKQMFGNSAYQYHVLAKMAEAQKLILSGKYSISEIGFMLGYSNLSHFNSIFKKHFQITPGRFQGKNR